MLNSFLTSAQQVFTLFLLMMVGFTLGKVKLLDDHSSIGLSNLAMYVVNPAMLIAAFQRDFVVSDFRNFGLALAVSFLIHLLLIILSNWSILEKDPQRKGIFRFSTIFSNCGFMGYPIMTSIVGSIGVYYGSAYVIAVNLLAWTCGIYLLTGKRENMNWKPMLFNPGVLGVVVAMVLYLLHIRLPDLIMVPLNHLSGMNAPIPMIVVGYQLSHADFSQAVRGIGAWSAIVMRLVVSPLLAIGLCLLLHLRGDVAIVMIIAASTPPGTLASMLAAKHRLNASLTSSVMSVQTAMSILTIPVFVGLGQYLLG